MSNITASWRQIERVLTRYAPDTLGALRGPATQNQIAALERKLGQHLPADFSGSLRIHNGMRDSYLGVNRLFNNEALLSTRDIATQWQMMKGLLEGGHFEAGGDLLTKTRKLKNDQWWRSCWIPMTDNEGDGFIVDLEPGARGKRGQVFYFYHDGARPRKVVAASYGEWLGNIAAQMAKGEFEIEDGGIWLDAA